MGLFEPFEDYEPFTAIEPPAPVFPATVPPSNYTATSKAAAEAVAPRTPNQRRRVYAFIKARGDHGATNEEIAEALGIPLSGSSARVNELQGDEHRRGLPTLIRNSGTTRPTKYKHAAIVWIACANPDTPEE